MEKPNGLFIRQKIDENNSLIEEQVKRGQFTLNPIIEGLIKENMKLQKECPHEFDSDGKCIYCDKEKN